MTFKKSDEDELEDHIIDFSNPIFGSYDILQSQTKELKCSIIDETIPATQIG